MTEKEKNTGNMYRDSILQWNPYIGCNFFCPYCAPSFQRQMKRQKPGIDKNGKQRGCQQCYDYEPHFHPERLNQSLPNTKGDQFIWACSSGDIYFAKKEWIEQVLDRIRELSYKTFFMQSKNPICFNLYDLPENLIIGTTIETNLDDLYAEKCVSKAPLPSWRYKDLLEIDHPLKSITIEPVIYFNWELLHWIGDIHPERVYIGYDTKNTGLPEPDVDIVKYFINDIKNFFPDIKVKEKYIKDNKERRPRSSETSIPLTKWGAHRSLGEDPATSPGDRFQFKNGGELN